MESISQPTLIINETIAQSNIRAMAEKARHNNVSFEPHFKTHQSKEVAEWFRNEGVESITVSSVSMAQYFSDNDWKNITIAFPVNILELDKINNILQKSSLTLLVQDVNTVKALKILTKIVEVFIEIDNGYHRSGMAFNSFNQIETVIKSIKQSKHRFKGFYCHAGNSYSARGSNEITTVYKDLSIKMVALKKEFGQYNPHIAIGDTPTCSLIESFTGIDSVHPGNFVYYDYTQFQIGSCNLDQIATYLLCPIVAKNIERNELIIYGGGVHLSKEGLSTSGGVIYGVVGKLNNGIFSLYDHSFVKSISQEHGIISGTPSILSSLQVGDLVAIIPIHSCMTVDCMQQIYTHTGTFISKMPL